MSNTVLLNNVEHERLRVVTRRSAALGDAVNLVLIFPTELEEVQREYPVFLRRDGDGQLQLVALLGLDRDENLFLGEDGWRGRHVPAILERGPFLIGFQQRLVDGEPRREPMIYVDLDHPSVGESEGAPVFLPHGGASPYLERISAVLRTIHQGTEIAKPMFAAFEEAGLVAPVAVEIRLSETEAYKLPDFLTIDAERLAGLDGESLARLNKAGFLRAAYFILASQANVGRLIELKNQKRRGGG